MDMTRYDEALAEWARQEAEAAEQARAKGDERALSLALMKKNMYETMLPALGHKAPEKLAKCAEDMADRTRQLRTQSDPDGADRCEVQRAAILRARALLFNEEEPV